MVAGGLNIKGSARLSEVERMTRSETGAWTTWETIASLPADRVSFAMVTIDNILYIVGGGDRNSSFEDSILKSADGQEWEEAESKLEIGRLGHTAIATKIQASDCAEGM